ncbi:MAG TPA: MBL fold metallo-hydrolase [Acidobacteriota bacterium]|jgi:ribonuclease BN (tRNA processing enzyme)
MELEVLGIGNAFTSCHFHTSFLIRSEQWYLLDAPQALLRLLRERCIDPARITGVICTHVHGDHVAGLETLALWKKYVQKVRLGLFTSARVYRELREKFFPSFADTFSGDLKRIERLGFADYFDYQELVPGEPSRLDSRLTVEVRHNWHPTPTLGLKLSASRTIGISGDTCYRPVLLKSLLQEESISPDEYDRLAGEWLWQADVIYHEVTSTESGPHTSEKDLLALPETVRRKLRAIHISDDYEEKELRVAREGERVEF